MKVDENTGTRNGGIKSAHRIQMGAKIRSSIVHSKKPNQTITKYVPWLYKYD